MKSSLMLTLLFASAPLIALGAETQNPDHDFYTQAAEAGMSEVDLGILAQQKAKDPAVKEFAAKMVNDHTSANAKLEDLATSKSVALPGDLSTAQKATRKTLDMQSAADFDQAYIKNQIDAHQDAIALLKKEIGSGKDPDAKALASSMLPIVEGHLTQVQQLQKSTASSDRMSDRVLDKTADTGSVPNADQ